MLAHAPPRVLLRAIRLALVFILAVTLSSSGIAQAASMVFDFTFENDGTLTNPPFGTLTVNETATDKLTLTIDVDNTKLGTGADVHEFGFMLNFAGAIMLAGGDALSLTPNAKVQGRNSFFDYVAGFGTGSPQLEPATFTIMGTGLNLMALQGAGLSTQNNKPNDAQFMAHIQGTSPLDPGSESIGGVYPSPVPEPTSALLFGVGGLIVRSALRRRRESRT